jgi:hypothetical protein
MQLHWDHNNAQQLISTAKLHAATSYDAQAASVQHRQQQVALEIMSQGCVGLPSTTKLNALPSSGSRLLLSLACLVYTSLRSGLCHIEQGSAWACASGLRCGGGVLAGTSVPAPFCKFTLQQGLGCGWMGT